MRDTPYDVIVIGTGIAGMGLASGLARAGLSVALVGPEERQADEFRAEKFGAPAMERLDRLGLGAAARAHTTPFTEVVVGRWGRLTTREVRPEFGMRYPVFMAAIEAALPSGIAHHRGHVTGATTGPETQEVAFADGRLIRGRLLVLATGLMPRLPRLLGLQPTVTSRAHTLIYGFDLAPLRFEADSLAWRGERFGDGIAYLTLFPLAGGQRANLFTHWRLGSERDTAFMANPSWALAALMPNMVRAYGEIRPSGPVQRRGIDLLRVENPARDGVVLVGDACCTTCPGSGTGIRKALADAETLVRLVPGWLASPGMAQAKIATYYADPEKVRSDEGSITYSVRHRRLLVERDLATTVQRAGDTLVTGGMIALRHLSGRGRASAVGARRA